MYKKNYNLNYSKGFEGYVNSLGVKAFGYGNATHAFADILLFLSKEKQNSLCKILMPSFIPAKLYRIILAYGWEPVFYEINESCEFDIDEINELIDTETKAVFVIHYFGRPANVQPVRELCDKNNIILIEDCAHVIYGNDDIVTSGKWGDFAIFSPRKMLNLPEGGYLLLNKDFHGFEPSYKKRVSSIYTLLKLIQSRGKGFYLNITKGNDVFGIAKIPERGYIDFTRNNKVNIKNISPLSLFYSRAANIEKHIRKRQRNYTYLFNNLREFEILKPLYYELPLNWTPYSLPVIVCKGFRDLLQSELAKAGISCGAGWPESPFENRLIRTLCLSKNLIELPVHPYLHENQLKRIIEVCRSFEDKTLGGNNIPVNWLWKKRENQQEKIRMGIIKSNEGFDNLGDEWIELCKKSDVHIFQTFEWQRLWWKHYGKGKELNILVFYSKNNVGEEKLVGIAPFFLDVKYIFGFRLLRRLRLIGCGVNTGRQNVSMPEYGVTDYLDLIIRPGFEIKIAEIIILYLRKNFNHYDIIQLDEIPPDSIIFKFLLPQLEDLKWKHKIAHKEICPGINLPSSLNDFLKQLSSNIRYRLRKTKKDIINNPEISIIKATPGTLNRMFDDLVFLHQKRWNHKGLPGLFSNEVYKDFLEEISYTFMKKDYLYLTGIYTHNICISAQYAFKYKNIYYDYLKAFNIESRFAKYRPGKALLLFLIEEALQNNFKRVDLLRGYEQYKFELANNSHYVNLITVNNPVNKPYLRYMLFLSLMFGVYLKYSVLKEINLIHIQIINSGIKSLISNYIPDFLARLKRKLTHSGRKSNKKPLEFILQKTPSFPINLYKQNEEMKIENV